MPDQQFSWRLLGEMARLHGCSVHGVPYPRPSSLARKVIVKLAASVLRKNGRAFPKHPSAHSIVAELQRAYGIVTSDSVVRRDLAAMGMVSRVRRWTPAASPQFVKKRLAFCRAVMKRPVSDYKLFVFSDEHNECINDHSHRRMFVPGDDPSKLLPREKSKSWNTAGFQLWAAVGFGYKSEIRFLPRTEAGDNGKQKGWRMNGQRYRDVVLRHEVARLQERIFMQDGASCHTSNIALKYLAKKGVRVLAGWPPHCARR